MGSRCICLGMVFLMGAALGWPGGAGAQVPAEAAADSLQELPGFPDVPLAKLIAPDNRVPAPQLMLKDMAGREITLESLHGRVVLVNFWATWCPPCKREIPQLVHLQETYGPSGFDVLGVALDQKGLAAVRPFVRGRREINYTIIPNGIRAGHAFGAVRRIPTSFLLDKRGRILKKLTGLHPQAELDGLVQAALLEEDLPEEPVPKEAAETPVGL